MDPPISNWAISDKIFFFSNLLNNHESHVFHSWISNLKKLDDRTSLSDVYNSIPKHDTPSFLPSLCFVAALERYKEYWPVLEVLSAYTKIWKTLPETVKSKRKADLKSTLFSQRFEEQIQDCIRRPLTLFHSSESPALIEPATKRTLSHKDLSIFINKFRLPLQQETLAYKKPTVVLALPNGFLLGLACIAVSLYYKAAPINISGGSVQFHKDVELIRPQAIMVLAQDIAKLDMNKDWLKTHGITILVVEENSKCTFETRSYEKTSAEPVAPCSPNTGDDTALILLTSGTSGTKKVVPITTTAMLIGISCVVTSWGLSSQDRCINMMPLNHVGGLVRNLFAPILSGGSTILCSSFDPNLFWDLLEDGQGTWYYASPSMHTSILDEKEFRDQLPYQLHLRLVCNAAGALLPALAIRLRDVFKCTILPSYGMTECMPISTPPLEYVLDRPGTSGISCGPELAIMGSNDDQLPVGKIGRICVRGGPTFAGYLQYSDATHSSLSEASWFDTGDLGYLDCEGYLYLTGRSKEVINRGGEIISPFEVEEAILNESQSQGSVIFERVKAVLAFSVPHDVLQEVVGVVIVPDSRRPKPCLQMLHNALKSVLHVSKLPAIVVYMEDLPIINNKVTRVRFAERLGLEPLTDNKKPIEKHYNAVCPPVNSSLQTKIENKVCSIDLQLIQTTIAQRFGCEFDTVARIQPQTGLSEVFIAPRSEEHRKPTDEVKESIDKYLHQTLDGFQAPTEIILLNVPIPRTKDGVVDEMNLHQMINRNNMKDLNLSNFTDTQAKVRDAIATVLRIPAHNIRPESDFFHLGGDSLSAGRLLSTLRRNFQIRIPIYQLFTCSTVRDLSALADSLSMTQDTHSNYSEEIETNSALQKMFSSTNPILLFINLLPITLFYPMKQAFLFTMFIYSLSLMSNHWRDPHLPARFLSLITAMAIARISTQVAAPMLGIMLKWLIIGRFKAGKYPMWGVYHTRWWIVDKILLVFGKGIFQYSHESRVLYYRALGARIGRGVTIEKGTSLGEFDLLEIDDNVHLNRCTCRPFASERNTTMLLGKISIGRNSSIDLKSHVAAGSILPPDTYIRPNSSSYEINDNADDYRGSTNGKIPEPHFLLQVLVILPVNIAVLFISSLPWMVALVGVVSSKPTANEHHGVLSVVHWWATPRRISFHYLAIIVHALVSPLVRFLTILIIKKSLDHICGKPAPRKIDNFSRSEILRTAVLDSLQLDKSLQKVARIFGKHYEVTSIAARALGARVGKRVYWPGTGPVIQDFDLLDIGDDVVFGSRSYLVTRDGYGSASIKIGAGSMIADRVILSPGTIVGNRAVMGSGSTTRRGQVCEPDSVWIGNKNGGAVCLSQTKPNKFGRSFRYSGPEVVDFQVTTLDNKGKISHITEKITDINRFRSINSGELSMDEKADCSNISRSTCSSSEFSSSNNSSTNTSSPFGRAFYGHEAPYYVVTLPIIVFYTALTTMITSLLWDTSTVINLFLSIISYRTTLLVLRPSRSFIIYGLNVCLLSGLLLIVSASAIFIVIAAKWIIIGRRKPGNYDWDKSNYCQRWQLYLTIEGIKSRGFNRNGVLGLLTGTYFMVLYYRLLGARIGSNTAIFAGGPPSAYFTEPDLLLIGDRVTIDDASLVSHINSRGKFDLRTLEVANGAVLRSGSRLLSGSSMGQDSILLEHTLIMAGDRADEGLVYQGWPAEVFSGSRVHSRIDKWS
ncbi:hypothetical protein K3495_g4834 [Podosphaera aphanis]|nr:hypothetical protein K3495_g4834 [Podosphaera aphanis]